MPCLPLHEVLWAFNPWMCSTLRRTVWWAEMYLQKVPGSLPSSASNCLHGVGQSYLSAWFPFRGFWGVFKGLLHRVSEVVAFRVQADHMSAWVGRGICTGSLSVHPGGPSVCGTSDLWSSRKLACMSQLLMLQCQ